MTRHETTAEYLYNKVYDAAITAHKASGAAEAAESARTAADSAAGRYGPAEFEAARRRVAEATEAVRTAAVAVAAACAAVAENESGIEASDDAYAAFLEAKASEQRSINDQRCILARSDEVAKRKSKSASTALLERSTAQSRQTELSAIIEFAGSIGHQDVAISAMRHANDVIVSQNKLRNLKLK